MREHSLVGLCLLLIALIHYSQCANKVIFISLDGFRHDYLDMAESAGRNISAFDRIRKAGFQAEVQNVMLTLTFPSHYAMATGRYVENHGLVGNTFRLYPNLTRRYRYTDNTNNLESEWFEYADTEPLWQTNQRHGHRSCVFQWVGSEARVQNKMAFATSGVYNENFNLTWRIDRIMDWISRDEFNLAMLYFNQPDKNGHAYGPNSKEVMDAVEQTNDGIAYLLQRIDDTPSLKDKVNIIVTSDHGMAEVDTTTRVINIYEKVTDTHIMRDGSPASNGLWPKPNYTIKQIYDSIKNFSEHMEVYLREDMPERYHFKKNPRIAPIFAIAKNGWLIFSQRNQYKDLHGMHGYDNSEPEMHPFMVAMGPDVQNMTLRQEFHQVDLYPYICAMLGLDKPNRIDGLIDRVVPFLKTPPTEEYLQSFRSYASGALNP